MPAVPAGATDSVDLETLIVDDEVTAVPGFGTLHAGVDATAAQRAAALDDAATIPFFRVKDSYATRVVEKKRATINDLYVDFLTGTVRVCPDGAPGTSSKCHGVVPPEDVTLPAGFCGAHAALTAERTCRADSSRSGRAWPWHRCRSFPSRSASRRRRTRPWRSRNRA